MSNQGKWDKAIRGLAGEVFRTGGYLAIEETLRDRLAPLLDAAEDVRDFYGTGGRKTIRILSQELDKWLTK